MILRAFWPPGGVAGNDGVHAWDGGVGGGDVLWAAALADHAAAEGSSRG